jgi:hypothetical protein
LAGVGLVAEGEGVLAFDLAACFLVEADFLVGFWEDGCLSCWYLVLEALL